MSKLTPAKLGYFMPAEWERHDAIWLAWPYDKTTFPDRVDKAEETYISIVKSIYQSEKINLLVLNHDVKKKMLILTGLIFMLKIMLMCGLGITALFLSSTGKKRSWQWLSGILMRGAISTRD